MIDDTPASAPDAQTLAEAQRTALAKAYGDVYISCSVDELLSGDLRLMLDKLVTLTPDETMAVLLACDGGN